MSRAELKYVRVDAIHIDEKYKRKAVVRFSGTGAALPLGSACRLALPQLCCQPMACP